MSTINRPLFLVMLDGISKLFAGAEFNDVGGLNFDRRAGLRIPSFTGFTADFLESPETHQRNLAVLFLQCFG